MIFKSLAILSTQSVNKINSRSFDGLNMQIHHKMNLKRFNELNTFSANELSTKDFDVNQDFAPSSFYLTNK